MLPSRVERLIRSRNVSARRPCQCPPLRLRKRATVVSAAQNFYEVLGVPASASDKEIKRAYRQKALKLHPDVNKAPDAQKRFVEAKQAFETLSDPQQRSQYDRKLRGGYGSDFWDSGTTWSTSSQYQGTAGAGRRPKPQQDEEFYGLGELFRDVGKTVEGAGRAARDVVEGALPKQWPWPPPNVWNPADLFRDLEKEADQWSKEQDGKGGKAKSLWEELESIGEEFVDFLEGSLGVQEDKKEEGARRKASAEDYKRYWDSTNGDAGSSDGQPGTRSAGNSTGTSSGQQASSSSSSSSSSGGTAGGNRAGAAGGAAAGAGGKTTSSEDEIEAMLQSIKKKFGG